MAFIPENYDAVNKPQQSDANELVDSLLKDNPGKVYDIILDIGSGTGNVTKQLCERIPHRRIIAIDIDPEMTRFARSNYSSNTIEYITQDISVNWDELNLSLKELEEKVSLVFSNRALHWVEDKETAVKNIRKFLAPEGIIAINITAIVDVTQNLSQELRESFVYFPSFEEQFEIWGKILTDGGIALSFAKMRFLEKFYDKNTFEGIYPALPKLYKSYLKIKDSKYREKFVNNPQFINAVFDKFFLGWLQVFKADAYQEFMKSDKIGVDICYGEFRFFGKKK